MNRTDQASEPSMEDILASIRLIISDDAKKGPSGREEHPSRLAPPRPETAPLNALPEEDVLDLTDALVFPEDKPSPRAPATMNEHHAMPAAALYEEPAEAQQDAIGEEPEAEQVADAPPHPDEAQPSAEPSQDLSRSTQPASRTIWSRRELPGSPPPVAPAVPRYEAPGRQPQKNWAQDIQMPIPDRGPVSLIPDQAPTQIQEIADAKQTAEWGDAESDADLSDGLGGKGEAAVAAIAESLARSAAGAMNSDELATAGDVDFSKLGEEQKAEVTETFANAIQSEGQPRNNGPLPTLLDEVLRQDFRREPSSDGEAADDLFASEASGAHEVSDEKANKEDAGLMWGAPAAFQSAAGQQPAQQVRDEPLAKVVQEKPAKTGSPRDAAAASPAASESPLENAVRDMLQPLLVQWLNEHMPRILESAIREEIATRGLSPKAEK